MRAKGLENADERRYHADDRRQAPGDMACAFADVVWYDPRLT